MMSGRFDLAAKVEKRLSKPVVAVPRYELTPQTSMLSGLKASAFAIDSIASSTSVIPVSLLGAKFFTSLAVSSNHFQNCQLPRTRSVFCSLEMKNPQTAG